MRLTWEVSGGVLVADRATPVSGSPLAALLGAGGAQREPAGGTGRDPDAAQQVQGWLGLDRGTVLMHGAHSFVPAPEAFARLRGH